MGSDLRILRKNIKMIMQQENQLLLFEYFTSIDLL